MGRKEMDSKEKVRIFAWRQENVTTKKVCRRTKRSRSSVMAFLVAVRDLPQNAIPATKSRLDDYRRPPNTLMIDCNKNYARTITLVHQNSRRCIQIISGTSPSDVSSITCRRT